MSLLSYCRTSFLFFWTDHRLQWSVTLWQVLATSACKCKTLLRFYDDKGNRHIAQRITSHVDSFLFVVDRLGRLTHTAMTLAWPSKRPGCVHWARHWLWPARLDRSWSCRWSVNHARRSCRPTPSISSATATTLCGRAMRHWRPQLETCASLLVTSLPVSCSSTPLLPAPPWLFTPNGSCKLGVLCV